MLLHPTSVSQKKRKGGQTRLSATEKLWNPLIAWLTSVDLNQQPDVSANAEQERIFCVRRPDFRCELPRISSPWSCWSSPRSWPQNPPAGPAPPGPAPGPGTSPRSSAAPWPPGPPAVSCPGPCASPAPEGDPCSPAPAPPWLLVISSPAPSPVTSAPPKTSLFLFLTPDLKV